MVGTQLSGSCSRSVIQQLDITIPASPKDITQEYTEFFLFDSIRVVLDIPEKYDRGNSAGRPLLIYALPNGNSIEWTMGKQMSQTGDWHYDIQHIDAQIKWLRMVKKADFILAYLEAPKLSWPAWKRSHTDRQEIIVSLIDTLKVMTHAENVVLSSHSGGGSLINGFIESTDQIPDWVKRIVFIDSNYGYDTAIGAKLSEWIKADSDRHLSVFAYNDSIALYEGKSFVSPTGGTWYRSKMMLNELMLNHTFVKTEDENLIKNRSADNQIIVILKKNPDRKIYHTQQVELNGFIHSFLFATEEEEQGYSYFGERCYGEFVSETTPVFVSLAGDH